MKRLGLVAAGVLMVASLFFASCAGSTTQSTTCGDTTEQVCPNSGKPCENPGACGTDSAACEQAAPAEQAPEEAPAEPAAEPAE